MHTAVASLLGGSVPADPTDLDPAMFSSGGPGWLVVGLALVVVAGVALFGALVGRRDDRRDLSAWEGGPRRAEQPERTEGPAQSERPERPERPARPEQPDGR